MSFIAAGVTVGLGATQAIIGGIRAGKAHREMENLKTPTYAANKPISDYYQSALNRYNTSPYQSNFYEQAQKMGERNLATGIGAMEDRHAGNIGALVQGSDDQLQKAGVQAEGMQRQDFGQLGQAANMKASDDRTAFQYNQVAPYEKALGIAQGKAVAGSQMENAGFQNISGGLGSYGMAKMFGGGGNSSGGGQIGAAGGLSAGGMGSTAQFSGNNTGLASVGGQVYQTGSNTDMIMNPGGYGNFGLGQ